MGTYASPLFRQIEQERESVSPAKQHITESYIHTGVIHHSEVIDRGESHIFWPLYQGLHNLVSLKQETRSVFKINQFLVL
jgi:hypothetical protein